jgi:Xaa-Pro dipeptidase
LNIHLDKAARFARIRAQMAEQDLDVLIGTRSGTVNYIAGAYLPWRSLVVFSRDGHEAVFTFLLDVARIKHESWLHDVVSYVPRPGSDLWELAFEYIRKNGWAESTLGIELGHSIRTNQGFLTATEYDLVRAGLPKAKLVNALPVIDRAAFIKEPGEIALMRQAAAMADSAIGSVIRQIEPGMSETYVAGIGEMELRRLGSEYHWAVTGGSEVASGYRAAWPFCGTTPPSEKIIQAGENVIVDFHPCYRGYLSDLGHNIFLGGMTPEQHKLADAFSDAAHVLVDAIKVGNTVRDVSRAVIANLESTGYLAHAIPMFGHGLGMIGNEWYVAIVDNEEFGGVVLEENVVEVAFLAITIPGVAGLRMECPVLATRHGGEMLNSTPLRPTVLALD